MSLVDAERGLVRTPGTYRTVRVCNDELRNLLRILPQILMRNAEGSESLGKEVKGPRASEDRVCEWRHCLRRNELTNDADAG